MSLTASQVSGAILMVRPRNFGFNAETALTNRFQRSGGDAEVGLRARMAFDAFAAALAAGTVVVYPMQAVSRRAERRAAILEQVEPDTGFRVRRKVDLTYHEEQGR